MIGDLESSMESTYQPDWKIGNLITGDTFYLTQHFGAQMKILKSTQMVPRTIPNNRTRIKIKFL